MSKKEETKVFWMPVCMSIGIGLGMLIGSVCGNIPAGMSIGVGLGLSVGIIADRITRNKD